MADEARTTLRIFSEGRLLLEIDYDPDFPCRMCDLPVLEPSMSSIEICPWCDSGYHRDGRKWSHDDMRRAFARAAAPTMPA